MADRKPTDAPDDMAGAEVDLESLGLHDLAYIKPAKVDDVQGFAIFAANGVAIGFAPAEAAAAAAILQNDMDVAPLH